MTWGFADTHRVSRDACHKKSDLSGQRDQPSVAGMESKRGHAAGFRIDQDRAAIGPVHGSTYLHGYTSSFAMFSERAG